MTRFLQRFREESPEEREQRTGEAGHSFVLVLRGAVSADPETRGRQIEALTRAVEAGVLPLEETERLTVAAMTVRTADL